jgi:AraC-like DNA-binding protein
MNLSRAFFEERRLETLVENKTSYTLQHAEMHIFETHQQAEQILLQFDQPVLATMLVGKKVMHLNKHEPFEFLPGESLILPAQELMCIDFPEADLHNPTRCLAMTISPEKIQEIARLMNENMPKAEQEEWQFLAHNFHFTNDIAIHQIIHRLLFLFTENHPSKEVFLDLSLRELVIRILQTERKEYHTTQSFISDQDNRLTYIIKYIRENLDKSLTVEELSRKAYMSESHFHRVFKNELGISPIDYINEERINLATKLLKDTQKKIKEIYMECGFNSMSYFNRVFKHKKKVSPKEYQLKYKSVGFD